jgi:hypothetical protein
MFRFTMINHMCRDMEQVHDTSLPPDMIRQEREPLAGGDGRIFLNNCIGCHSGMDPLARAFAYYDFDNGTPEAPGSMRLGLHLRHRQPKYFNNNTNFAPGFITPDDQWTNRWPKVRTRCSAGARRSRAAVPVPRPWVKNSHSTAFAQCQVEKVFKTECLPRSRATPPTAHRSHHDQQLQDQRLPAQTGLCRNRCVLHGRLREHT